MNSSAGRCAVVLAVLAALMSEPVQATDATRAPGKFVPPPGRTLLLVGQDVQSIDQYLQHVDAAPAGFMLYTSTRDATGLWNAVDYGAGRCDARRYTKNPRFAQTVLQLGLYMVDDLEAVTRGTRDRQLAKIGDWIAATRRPVYLRIGYEFDGPWNHYAPAAYVQAYRHIVDLFRARKVTNVAYVWASAGVPLLAGQTLQDWYPGDAYVDWVGVSVFRQFDGTLGSEADLQRVCDFARAQNLPLAITESTPYGGSGDAHGQRWFRKLFAFIEQHDVRMLCYINANWETQRMWQGQGWGDCRLEAHEAIKEYWRQETGNARYLKAGEELFRVLGFGVSQAP